MPLGKLSKQQIARGFEALEALEEALKDPGNVAGGRSLEDLSSHFYTVIPHNFGRNRPPLIKSLELLRAKKDMLLVRPGAAGGWRRGPNRREGKWPSRQTWTRMGRPEDRELGRVSRWTDAWGGHGPSRVTGEGRQEVACTSAVP